MNAVRIVSTATEASLPRPGRIRTSTTISILVLASAQIAMPLVSGAVFLSWVVILALAVSTWSFAAAERPFLQVLLVAGSIFAAATAIEILGVHLDVPFGQYEYTSKLQPQLFDVPLLVGIAWFAMLLPAWDIACRITPVRWLQTICCGAAMVVWDLFLDPQMIENGFWYFEHPSGWNGVPLSNAIGWFVTGTVLAWIPTLLFKTQRASTGLAFLYTWMIGFSALGYMIPFALDDPATAIVGTLCAAPLLYFAFSRELARCARKVKRHRSPGRLRSLAARGRSPIDASPRRDRTWLE